MSHLLDDAVLITSGDRRRDYSHPLENFCRIAVVWAMYMKFHFTPVDVAWMMILMKGAREANTYKYDNLLDLVGYAICIENMSILYLKMQKAIEHPTKQEIQEGINLLVNISASEIQNILEKFNNGGEWW